MLFSPCSCCHKSLYAKMIYEQVMGPADYHYFYIIIFFLTVIIPSHIKKKVNKKVPCVSENRSGEKKCFF